ncbi:hypothetical protein SDC9_101303 [bioreactor metagenome]|uniref:Uncharacterized protein n=1 Tax=bioreactor metagenome TaxID=1076179 RepID=A0A645AMS3_9ZZZZ
MGAGFVIAPEIVDAALINIDRVGPEVDRKLRFYPEHIGKFQRPVIVESRFAQQPPNQHPVLGRIGIADKALGFFHRRQPPEQIQIDPANPNRIRRRPRRSDARHQPLFRQQLVQIRYHRHRLFLDIDTRGSRPSGQRRAKQHRQCHHLHRFTRC